VHGCKSEGRMAVGCPFITCAVKKKRNESAGNAMKTESVKNENHRESGKKADSFKCYQKLEDDIVFILKNGAEEFEKTQKRRKAAQRDAKNFNEGRSKSYYCIAATVLEIEELSDA